MAANNLTPFELGDALNDEGNTVPAYGFSFEGMFIVDARLSECGQFAVEPAYYGLTEAQANELARLNARKEAR